MTERVNILAIRNATKRFGGLTAVDDVSFDIKRGAILGVIGPNGAGKSTLFNLVTGLAPLTGGQVEYNGLDMARVPAHTRSAIGISRTFQIVRQFGHLPVVDNVMLGGHAGMTQGFLMSLLRLPKVLADNRRLREKAMEALEFVGLAYRAGEAAGHLPHGQQRLLEIARSMVADPQILLLDEPAAGLNPSETDGLLAIVRGLNQRGVSIMIIEHDINFVMNLCDRIVVLDHGARIAAGTPHDIQQDPAVIEAYLGRPADAAR